MAVRLSMLSAMLCFQLHQQVAFTKTSMATVRASPYPIPRLSESPAVHNKDPLILLSFVPSSILQKFHFGI